MNAIPPELVKQAQSIKVDKNQLFIERLHNAIERHFQDCEFNRMACAQMLHLSDRQFSRKIRNLLDRTFPELLRKYRLNQATIMLADGEPLAHIFSDVGFSCQAYFCRCFKAQYGKTPSQYQKEHLS